MGYTQITDEERAQISALRQAGLCNSEIGRLVNRHKTTIAREFARNSCNDGHYRIYKAAHRTRGRRSRSRRNRRFSAAEFQPVVDLLRERWSPEQISVILSYYGILSISHETIYKYIRLDRRHGGTLYKDLRQAGKQRRKRFWTSDSRGRLPGKRHISERPLSAENRSRFGHLEIDTVLGKGSKHSIVTMVDRKGRNVAIGKLKNRTVKELNRRVIQMIRTLRSKGIKVLTITADNGTEFHGYRKIEKATGVKFYFARPYHSWERGTSENTNGLIRQYLPKGMDMVNVTQRHCSWIANKLNNRPRKILGFLTPEEYYGWSS